MEDKIKTSFSLEVDKYIRTFFKTQDLKFVAPDLYKKIIQEVERPLIQVALEVTKENRVKAASILGINRNTLLKKMRLLGLDENETKVKRRRKRK